MYEARLRNGKERLHILCENATSILDAVEAVTIEYSTSNSDEQGGEMEVYSVFLSKYKEVARKQNASADEDHRWYDTTVYTTFEDENTGKVKKNKYHILVEASDFDDATAQVRKLIEQGYDMETFSVQETDFHDVL